jgi:DNA-binding transcriptional regulator LsrR (DeoR family)
VLELARAVELAIVGIGTTDPKNSSFLRAGYLTASELTKIRQQGAVGDVCGIHFNLQGQVQDFNITDRVVGIDENELRAIPQTIGVAAGAIKAPAILGALRANFINILVTDDAAALKMLELETNGS